MLMMLPFEAPTIFEGIHKSYFRMPRVVKDQRSRYENDDLFRQLSHECAVKYTGHWSRSKEERQMHFIAGCHEGHTEISVIQNGNQFTLMFNANANPAFENEGCDFEKELGKVHIKAGFILNGVSVVWRGWIEIATLEGFGCLEFDECRACFEDAMLKQQFLPGALQPHQVGQPPPPPPSSLAHQHQHQSSQAHHQQQQQQVPVSLPASVTAAAAAAAAALISSAPMAAAAAAAANCNPFQLHGHPLGPPPPPVSAATQQALLGHQFSNAHNALLARHAHLGQPPAPPQAPPQATSLTT